VPVSLSLAGATPRTVKGEILTAPALDAHNTFENPDAVHPTRLTGAALKSGKLSLTLPAKSVAVVSLE
jgi:alpha-N-arabinofuranosidase